MGLAHGFEQHQVAAQAVAAQPQAGVAFGLAHHQDDPIVIDRSAPQRLAAGAAREPGHDQAAPKGGRTQQHVGGEMGVVQEAFQVRTEQRGFEQGGLQVFKGERHGSSLNVNF